ncbi:inositol monophosphatase [Microvirga sp. STS02]|uniref:inositol monophosphatase family protein n=1 Tax=Hymenobacter negativus TaxID=2795026 RepID=UPI0018DB052B|nr:MULTISPECIES: inositol monophosphatase family protein [Bacteria]MBH8570291.1 inositol monophosphatase [Hymenobacter negativus]MBR7210030.1 inositol monophosphatase [Microvirga sp. STS02]
MSLNFTQLSHDLAALCRSTAEFIREEAATFDRAKIEHKGVHDLVSYVDQETERRLVAGLRQLLPEAGFITEEGTAGPDAHTEEFVWIIDPLDGTTNFVHGLPVYCISVALAQHQELVVGVVHEVGRDESFRAVRNGGAFCNDQPIRVTDVAELNSSLIATGFPYKDFGKMDAFLQILGAFFTRSHGVRRLGSAAADLAYVAAGRCEGFFEFNLNSYDVAAGILLVREAGGHVTQFLVDGDPLFGREIVASNGLIHREMQAAIGEFWQ